MTHSAGKPIGSSATKHFILAKNVEGMEANAHVEGVLSCRLEHIFVNNNAASLKALRTKLLLLTTHQVDGHRKSVGVCASVPDIKNGDFGIGNTYNLSKKEHLTTKLCKVRNC